jgi:Xaa-Pro aminopeptidase
MNEFKEKQEKIKALLAENKVEAILLNRISNFAWLTCGAASYVNTASTEGVASMLITPKSLHIITNNIEAPRLEKEEQINSQGWKLEVTPWYTATTDISKLTKGMKLAADMPIDGTVDLSTQLTHLRMNLLPEEIVRFKLLGKLCAEAMDEAIHKVKPGQTEYEIAGTLAQAAENKGVQAIVNLIATDERIFSFRHPLPTVKKMEKYAMLVLCGRKAGLVCSITRLIHFGKINDELSKKQAAVAKIDATFIHYTRPGFNSGQIFNLAVKAYAASGFPDEWKLHHQGGPAAYEPREMIVTPDSVHQVAAGQVYAWNPSITGTKSEDTILVDEKSNEVLSVIPDWPIVEIQIDGENISRPAILEVL